ncbi:MAG: tetratricopeptide repeat protein [Victivallales bacterium]
MNKMRFTFSIVPALLLFCACTSPSGKELASRYNAEGKYDAAAHAATEGLRNGEKDPLLYLQRARAYFAQGKRKAALADADVAVKEAPELAAARLIRGMLREQSGDYDGAIADYQSALKLNFEMKNPDLARARTICALAKLLYYKKDQKQAALSMLEDQYKLNTRDVRVLDTYAWLLAHSGRDSAKALALAEGAAEFYPSAPTLETLAYAQAVNGKWQDAVRTQENAIRYAAGLPQGDPYDSYRNTLGNALRFYRISRLPQPAERLLWIQ